MIRAGKDTAFAQASPEPERVPQGWTASLESMAAKLKAIAGTTEDEFLAIGGRLQDFYGRGSDISSLASEMVGEVAGDNVSAAMDGLRGMLDEMESYVENANGEVSDSSRTLHEILSLLEKASGPLSGFKKVNKVLRMLGISTKIESARLGQSAAGFDTLASDVGELAVQVNEKAGVIQTRKDELSRTIEQTVSGVLDSGAQQQGQVKGILEKTRDSLAALTALNERCSSAASGIARVSEEVSRNIGEVVMSMQTHDIVRQQIEHVDEALTDLKGRLYSGEAGADEAACVCELQAAQLRHAAEELEAAVGVIIASLKEVARTQSRLSQETRGMAGVADQTGAGFFVGIQRDLAVVSAVLLESARVNHTLCVAMGGVAETVGEIADFVGEIERIGEEIKLIALNAQIKSAYTGDEGAALGVLAEAIQRLSIEAIEHTTVVSSTLQGIIAVTQGLNNGICAETSTLEAEVCCMVEKLSSLVEVLRGVNQTLVGSLCRMDAEVNQLSGEIDQVTSGITVHHKVSRVLKEAIEGLGQIVSEARRLAPASERPVNLDQLAGRYTMHSERRIHQSLFDHSLPQGAAAAGDGGLGDNVDLF